MQNTPKADLPQPLPPLADTFTASHVSDQRLYDKIIISGGGLAAIFTAYEILRKSQEAGKKIDVLVLADQISAPCTAGSHAVLELEGMYENDIPDRPVINQLLRAGLDNLENTIARENIDCRFRRGYEIKATNLDALKGLVDGMIDRDMYRPGEIHFNSASQIFRLPGHDHSVSIDSIGQVNMPDLIHALADRIQKMGATIMLGARYQSQSVDANGLYTVRTNVGEFQSYSKPFMATGAEHQRTLADLKNIKSEVVYTMGLVLGPLSPEDAAKISKHPMAMCNTDLNGDVLWGGIDDKNVFTLGRGDIQNPTEADKCLLQRDIVEQIESFYPGLTKKYPPVVSFGPMLVPENRMPVVGRMKNFDIAGGWAGMGVVAGYAAADAYSDWIVHGRDDKLKIFEAMQPGKFAPDFTATTTAPDAAP